MRTPQEIAESVLALSTADICMVFVDVLSGHNFRWANSAMTTNGSTDDLDVRLVVVNGGRVVSVHRSYAEDMDLAAFVRDAEAECAGQPVAPDLHDMPVPVVDADWSAAPGRSDVADIGRIVPGLAEAFRSTLADDLRLFGYAEHEVHTTYFAASTGARRRYEGRSGQVELNLKTPDFGTTVWVGQATKHFDDVDIAAMMAELRQRMEWSQTKIDLPAGKYTTLLTPSAMADLLIYAYWTGAARDADEGRTVFSRPDGGNRIGDRLSGTAFDLYSDPAHPGMEVMPFDRNLGGSSHGSVFDNGASVERVAWIQDGVLANLIAPRYWAAQQGVEPHLYVDNLIMTSPSSASLDEMIAGVEDGLLVTCLWYIREVDETRLLLTGLTRDGVYKIENGKVVGVVNNFRWNMSPVEMLDQIVALGASVPTLAREWGDYFKFAQIPPVVIRAFNMSTVSAST